jgi:hypothetical protein
MPMDMIVNYLLNIFKAPTVQAAIVSGKERVRQRQTGAETEEWPRCHFALYRNRSPKG